MANILLREKLIKDTSHKATGMYTSPDSNNDILDLTIAIPVKNEEINLAKCLMAIGKNFARHVVIIDSGSTDQTKDIAARFGVEVVDFNWNGKFPKKRNWYLRTHSIKTKWILFLDADEYLTPDFKMELRQELFQSKKTGYWLNYSVYFLGKQMKGGYPLRKLALFKVKSGEYEHIDEDNWSHLDMEVHEHPVIDGEIGIISSKIDHQDYRGIPNFIAKHTEYATWEAARFLKVEATHINIKSWTIRQKFKYRLLHSIFLPPLFFLGSFFLYGGFRDGARGFAYSVLRMSYYMQIYCRIKEFKKNQAKKV